MGWDTQLPDEPIINVGYTVAHLSAAGRAGKSAEWRVVSVGTAAVGNYFTGVGARSLRRSRLESRGRLGWHGASHRPQCSINRRCRAA